MTLEARQVHTTWARSRTHWVDIAALPSMAAPPLWVAQPHHPLPRTAPFVISVQGGRGGGERMGFSLLLRLITAHAHGNPLPLPVGPSLCRCLSFV